MILSSWCQGTLLVTRFTEREKQAPQRTWSSERLQCRVTSPEDYDRAFTELNFIIN